MASKTITNGAVITISNSTPVGLNMLGPSNKRGRIQVTNDDATNYVVFYVLGGDPAALPNGWTWDNADADGKIYVLKGETKDLPAVKNMVAQANGGSCKCRFANLPL